jgi:hypothetical protein
MVLMTSWTSTILIAVGTSLATTTGVDLTVGPRLAARSARIQANHADRDQFGQHVITIIARCPALEAWSLPAGLSAELRARLEAEHDRMVAQVEEATVWLADNILRYALGYVGTLGLRDLVGRYAAEGRGLWLSERPEAERARMLREVSEPVQTIFFARRWRVALSIRSERRRLTGMLDILNPPRASVPPPAPEPAPAAELKPPPAATETAGHSA